ncbi:hypothetical protein MNBD_ALPHA06-1120 [hydrothermal vent metagenome]|uniref:N-acetyltransferase domain-containing protein n=1 Tax=hydrothermal vent metagenome TaxID=652676 RepID=A0A3B0S6Q1_9ZZZZ
MKTIIDIQAEKPDSPHVALLLQQHFELMNSIGPAESVHAIKPAMLDELNIQFWTAKREDQLAGCGALLDLGHRQCELKSMHTVLEHRQKGVATALLHHMIEQAKIREFDWLRLETGASDAFAASRALYAKTGFVSCPPFSQYKPDQQSCFMELNVKRLRQVQS